jgi:hypothetical protein
MGPTEYKVANDALYKVVALLSIALTNFSRPDKILYEPNPKKHKQTGKIHRTVTGGRQPVYGL